MVCAVLAPIIATSIVKAIEAGTGMEALEQLKKNPDIGVAILDIMLPDIDGFEVCRNIRATNKTFNISVNIVFANYTLKYGTNKASILTFTSHIYHNYLTH